MALLDLLVPALRAGLPVSLALEQVDAGRAGWVADLCAHLRVEALAGRPLARVWAEHAGAAGSSEGSFVARAWGLSETLGGPVAESVEEAAAAVRQRIARTQRLGVVVAGPRATSRVLSLLPLAGPVVAGAMGVPVALLYSGVGALSAAAGVVLLLLGRLWCARLVAGVVRPMTADRLP